MITTELKEKINKILKKILDFTLYVLGITAAFIIGFYCNQLTGYYESKSTKFSKPLESNIISVAVTEHNELLIINRYKQTIDVYSDTVGIAIFKAYANRITKNVK